MGSEISSAAFCSATEGAFLKIHVAVGFLQVHGNGVMNAAQYPFRPLPRVRHPGFGMRRIDVINVAAALPLDRQPDLFHISQALW